MLSFTNSNLSEGAQKWPSETGSTDLYLSCVFGIEFQSFIALTICSSYFQHGLQLLVMSGQL